MLLVGEREALVVLLFYFCVIFIQSSLVGDCNRGTEGMNQSVYRVGPSSRIAVTALGCCWRETTDQFEMLALVMILLVRARGS